MKSFSKVAKDTNYWKLRKKKILCIQKGKEGDIIKWEHKARSSLGLPKYKEGI